MGIWLQTSRKAVGGASRHGASAHYSPLLRWLVSLGGIGLLGVAILDSSMIPLPLPGSTDLLLLLLVAHRRTTVLMAVWLASCAFVGSMVGGYLAWRTGRKGGEVTLEKYVPRRILGRITGWVERHGALSVGISAILPPPVPLTPFLLAAGALKVPLRPFLISYGTARALRYGLLAWLGYAYGRHIVTVWEKELNGWSSVILWSYLGLLLAGIVYAIWKMKRGRSTPARQETPAEDVA
jgi:membrane protein YqaA with SNARE-associated domain